VTEREKSLMMLVPDGRKFFFCAVSTKVEIAPETVEPVGALVADLEKKTVTAGSQNEQH